MLGGRGPRATCPQGPNERLRIDASGGAAPPLQAAAHEGERPPDSVRRGEVGVDALRVDRPVAARTMRGAGASALASGRRRPQGTPLVSRSPPPGGGRTAAPSLRGLRRCACAGRAPVGGPMRTVAGRPAPPPAAVVGPWPSLSGCRRPPRAGPGSGFEPLGLQSRRSGARVGPCRRPRPHRGRVRWYRARPARVQ